MMTTLCREIANTFIEEFAPLYFSPDNNNPDVLSETEYRKRRNDWDIPSLNSVEIEAENVVMELLRAGDFGESAFAWKAGAVEWDKARNKLTNKEWFKKDNSSYLVGQRRKSVSIESFNGYCKLLYDNKDKLNELVSQGERSQAYTEALFIDDKKKKTRTPDNFGPVNIINALFFISKERMPIYDAYAHIAVRALALDISPKQVFLGSNPNKNDVSGVTRMFEEYILLLKKVFPHHVNTERDEPFIPRELDRALWVYGHAGKKYRT